MRGLLLGLDAAEHRTPDRMPGLGLVQIEGGIDLQRLSELVAALTLSIRHAIHKRQILVRVDLVVPGLQLAVEARLDLLLRLTVVSLFEGPDALRELLLGRPDVRGQYVAQRPRSASREHHARQDQYEPPAAHQFLSM